ncbi:MAG: VacJ family lipoprotein [Holosporales bacterium]|jgi:phospholipid-binding lipoprotein MlaA|nr:VacJ family lipoprotein [Holosporales bacterium]
MAKAKIFTIVLMGLCLTSGDVCSASDTSATPASDAGEWVFEDLYEDDEEPDYDPFEPFNRLMFALNSILDKVFLMPVATAYRHITPNPMQTCISNALDNFFSPIDAVNFILQGDGERVVKTVFRFLINTVLGVFGAVDVAAKMGIDKKTTSFGNTLKKWGAKPGPYLVLPLLGQGSMRSGVGKLVHIPLDPLTQLTIASGKKKVRRRWYYVIYGTNIVVKRSALLPITNELEKVSDDKYVTTRKAVMSMEQE